jgi:FixJ family two-component response regulator
MKTPLENNIVKRKAGVSEIPRVSIVDDDESVREAVKNLLRSVGFGAEAFASAADFLNSGYLKDTACLILDLRMPETSGLELQQKLVSANWRIPIIFITAHVSDKEARARALQLGAVGFLYKPFSEEDLLNAVYAVLGSGGYGGLSVHSC